MNQLKVLQLSIRRISNEILIISKQIIKHKPKSRNDFRQVLLQTTTASNQQEQKINHYNQIAVNILKLDKELNLLQYHGLLKYLSNYVEQRKNIKTSKHSVTEKSNDDTTTRQEMEPKAQVAFMITAQQRQLLVSQYGYTQDQIKRMKPNEAQIILQHNICVMDENDSSWRDLVKDIIEKEEKQHQEEEKQHRSKKQELEDYTKEQDNTRKNDILSIGFEEKSEQHEGNTSQINLDKETKMDNHLLHKNDNEVSLESSQSNNHVSRSKDQDVHDGKNCWYEIVKVTMSSSSEQIAVEEVIALYKTLQEAEECLIIKKDLARKAGKSSAHLPYQKQELLIRKRIIK